MKRTKAEELEDGLVARRSALQSEKWAQTRKPIKVQECFWGLGSAEDHVVRFCPVVRFCQLGYVHVQLHKVKNDWCQ